jgi:hypothetical protein
MANCDGGGWYEQKWQEEFHEPKPPKAKLGLPDLDHSKSAVLDSLRSRESKRGYSSPWCKPRGSTKQIDGPKWQIDKNLGCSQGGCR